MATDILEGGAEPALELCFSDEWLQAAEPDRAAWHVGALADEPEDGVWTEYGVPLGQGDEDVPTSAWNLDAFSLRRVAAAAAFVPLLSIAEPAFAAPPTSASVSEPSPAPAALPSMWEALVQQRVLITLQNGLTFRGTVLSATDGVLVCARAIDGLMVMVDITQISYVNVEALPGDAPPKQPQTGKGLIILGTIATAVGGALTLATLAVGAACLDSSYGYYEGYVCPYYTVPLAVASVVHLSVGIPLLVSGLRKRKAYRAATAAPIVSAFVAPGREGAMVGVGVRF
jgi:hypothetical protein